MTLDGPIAIGGENLIDRVVQVDEATGASVSVDKLGGSPFNVAIGLARQGVFAHYVTPISTDAMGQDLAGHLSKEGVVLSGERRAEPTTLATVTLDNGTPSYLFQRDGTAERCVTVRDIEAALPKGLRILHVGSLAFAGGADADAWEQVCVKAKASGVFLSIDPNVRGSLITDPEAYRRRMFNLFGLADLIKLSDEDLTWIYEGLDLKAAMSELQNMSDASLIVLTKGPDGAEGYTSRVEAEIPAAKVDPLVDTIGAGDTFMASLLALANGGHWSSAQQMRNMDRSSLVSALTRASQAAALNCQQEGCDPPSSDMIDRALKGILQ